MDTLPDRFEIIELEDLSPRDSVRGALKAEIVRRLPFLGQIEVGTTAQVAEGYIKSLRVLEGFRADVDALVPFLCRANLEFRAVDGEVVNEVKEPVMAKKLDRLIDKTRIPFSPLRNAVDADLLALPAKTAARKLRGSLHRNVEQFLSDFFDGLDRLVDQHVCGLVNWTSQNTCRYHFFREVLVQETLDIREELGATYDGEAHGLRYQEVDEVVTGTHTHRLARHEHHTTEAIQTRIADSKVVMPPAVRELVNRIPDWLETVVRIIDGTLARAIIIEQDIETETWETREARDPLVFEYEPAVVIDHIVLTGWGPVEINAEVKRLASETQVRQKLKVAQRKTLWVCAAGALSALSLISHWNSEGPLGLATAFCFAVAAGICGLIALTTHAATESRPWAFGQPYVATTGLVLALTGVGLTLSFGFAVGKLILLPIISAAVGLVLLSHPWFAKQSSQEGPIR